MGGDVKGGKLVGQFPQLLTAGPSSISGTGQILPMYPWEAMWRPLLEWFGLSTDKMDEVLPNLNRFRPDSLFTKGHYFKS